MPKIKFTQKPLDFYKTIIILEDKKNKNLYYFPDDENINLLVNAIIGLESVMQTAIREPITFIHINNSIKIYLYNTDRFRVFVITKSELSENYILRQVGIVIQRAQFENSEFISKRLVTLLAQVHKSIS